MSADKVQAFADKLLAEIERTSHLSKEQKELLEMEVNEALQCIDEAETKWDVAASLVAMTTLRRIRSEVRFADDVALAVERAIEKLMSQLPQMLQEAFNAHTNSCPMGSFDPEEFYKKIMEQVDKKTTAIIRVDNKQSRTPKTWGEIAKNFANKAVEQYMPVILLALIYFVVKYGYAGILDVIKAWHGVE